VCVCVCVEEGAFLKACDVCHTLKQFIAIPLYLAEF
jgi:hypothetical protein